MIAHELGSAFAGLRFQGLYEYISPLMKNKDPLGQRQTAGVKSEGRSSVSPYSIQGSSENQTMQLHETSDSRLNTTRAQDYRIAPLTCSASANLL